MSTYIPARNYTPTAGRQIDLEVIHTAETPETKGRARNIAEWFAGKTAPRASAHHCHDADESIRCVRDEHVAWAAPGANHNGIQHELAGYARQGPADWRDHYSQATMRRAAAQCAIDVRLYDLPLRFVRPAGLIRGERGFTIHRYVSEAFKRSTHWDTGYHFPEDQFLEMVADALDGKAPPASRKVAAPTGVLRRGSTGAAVAQWQRILAGAGLIKHTDVDGIFGPQTHLATRRFQSHVGVTSDGIVGPETRAATAKVLAWVAAQRPIPKVPPFPGTVRRGSRGPAVEAIQARLRARGWAMTVDGVFGPRTEQTVMAFQREKGLAIDGIAGPNTWEALWTAPVT